MTSTTNPNPTPQPNAQSSTRRVLIRALLVVAWLLALVAALVFLVVMRRVDNDFKAVNASLGRMISNLDNANADPRRRNAATNAPAASVDR